MKRITITHLIIIIVIIYYWVITASNQSLENENKSKNTMGNYASAIGLTMCSIPILVHGPEVWHPTLSRFVANFWLPPFTLQVPATLRPGTAVGYPEQLEMLLAAVESVVGPEKKEAARDLIFVMLFESRQGSAGFLAAAAGAAYASGLGLEERHPVHLVFTVLSVLMAFANANQALSKKYFPFGHHPFVSKNGWAVGVVFTPFWLLSTYCNYVAFHQSRLAAGKV